MIKRDALISEDNLVPCVFQLFIDMLIGKGKVYKHPGASFAGSKSMSGHAKAGRHLCFLSAQIGLDQSAKVLLKVSPSSA